MPAASRADQRPDEPPSEGLVRAAPIRARPGADRALSGYATGCFGGALDVGQVPLWSSSRLATATSSLFAPVGPSPTSDWKGLPLTVDIFFRR